MKCFKGEKNIILYFNNGQAFLPVCSNVSSIMVNSFVNRNDCDKEIKIAYTKQQKTNRLYNGYLRENNIITQFSSRLDNCLNQEKSLIVVDSMNNSNVYLIRRNQTQVQVSSYTTHLTKFKVNRANFKDLFNHHDFLVNGSDFYEKMQIYTDSATNDMDKNIEQKESTSNIFDNANVLDRNIVNDVASSVKNFFGDQFLFIKDNLKIAFSILALFIFLILMFVIFKNFDLFQKISFKKSNKQNYHEMDYFLNP